VFQHIPSRDVVFRYLQEAWRVLKPGGVLRCQLNGLPATAKQYDTWSGVRIAPEEIRAFAREQGFQLLALEDIWTQYMWTTMRKVGQAIRLPTGPCAIRNINSAFTGEPAAPDSGPMAMISLRIADLPADVDLNNLTVTADGAECRVTYIGEPAADGATQVNAVLPERIRTGIVPVEVQPGGATGIVRIIPAGPAVPRVAAVTDGVNLMSYQRSTSGIVKVVMRDLARPEDFRATIDGRDVRELDAFCTDRMKQLYEFNFHLPEGTAPGGHVLRIAVGRREFAPIGIEVA